MVSAEGVEFIGAAIVTLEGSDGGLRLNVDPQIEPGAEEGALFLEMLFPASVRKGPAVGRQADAAASYYRSIGAESNLLKELGENLAPNGAALVLLINEHWVHDVEHALNSSSLSRFVLHSEVPP